MRGNTDTIDVCAIVHGDSAQISGSRVAIDCGVKGSRGGLADHAYARLAAAKNKNPTVINKRLMSPALSFGHTLAALVLRSVSLEPDSEPETLRVTAVSINHAGLSSLGAF